MLVYITAIKIDYFFNTTPKSLCRKGSKQISNKNRPTFISRFTTNRFIDFPYSLSISKYIPNNKL